MKTRSMQKREDVLQTAGGRTSLPLPAEIIREIFTHLKPPRSLCLVNKQILPFAQEILYEKVEIFYARKLEQFRRTMNAKPELGLLVKEFLISTQQANPTKGEYKLVTRYFKLFSKLKQLNQLYIYNTDWLSADFLLGEYDLPKLTKIEFTGECDLWQNPFDIRHWKNLANHPKLKEIDLTFHDQGRNKPRFSASGPKPVLKNLSIAKLSLEWFDTNLSEENVGEWLQYLAPTALEFSPCSMAPNPFLHMPANLIELDVPWSETVLDSEFFAPLRRFIHLERLAVTASWLLDSSTGVNLIPHDNLIQLTVYEACYIDETLQAIKTLAGKLRDQWGPKIELITLRPYSDDVYDRNASPARLRTLSNLLEPICQQRKIKLRSKIDQS